ncbi:hypothetical protein BRC86_10585 [Halobacteriales archaeon QS_3_64_16]|nr:MAG: hypothetical protein BRC86_10585 [Halobacteriales archaeon QS_3_64_16]
MPSGNSGGGSAVGARLRSLVGRVSSGPVRCEGAPTSVTERTGDPAGGDLEHSPANRTFRVGVAETASGTRFETVPFEEWMRIECADAGAERAHEAAVDRLETGGFDASSASLPTGLDSLVVPLTTTNGDRGNRTADSDPVALWRLVHAGPRSVEATVSIEGDSYTRTVAVFAEPMSDAVAL